MKLIPSPNRVVRVPRPGQAYVLRTTHEPARESIVGYARQRINAPGRDRAVAGFREGH